MSLKAIEGLINEGRYQEALDQIATEEDKTPKKKPNPVRLRQFKGISLARLNKKDEAFTILNRLYKEGHNDPETLGPLARIYFDRYDSTGRVSHLRKSRDLYALAFEKNRDSYYAGINAAAKSLLLSDVKAANQYADQVESIVGRRATQDYWKSATAAEVQLIKCDYEKAAALYGAAVEKSPQELGSHRTTWLQARRLMTALKSNDRQLSLIWRAFRHSMDASPNPAVLAPAYRRLQVYAFDPSLAAQFEMAAVNKLTLQVRWEKEQRDAESILGTSSLEPGPKGEYLEVIDYDPASGCFYEPVDLDDQRLLATDGLTPSEGDPKFHQQMVYAVAMDVIDRFERALGRRALWSSRLIRDENHHVIDEKFVPRLRIYPHALREANAYYSPEKKALLFGYFPAEGTDPSLLPGGIVFSCLSHDIVAHEMSHALLDGLHPRFTEPTNHDVLAFHEAFADIVALFQHFSHPEVLRHEIARTRGDLDSQSLLGELAQQFGRATGGHGALRSAIGEIDEESGKWRPTKPNPEALHNAHEPHARGAILVAAVFDAFLSIYRSRIVDLLRIASEGSGILRAGALHPDLVNRLADEAAKTASHLLQICIRALDYCPPVDIDFGDYLRAIITADVDMVPNDKRNYRLAIIEGFQRRGIYPRDVRNLSVESLLWRPPRGGQSDLSSLLSSDDREKFRPEWRPAANRRELWSGMRANANAMHQWLIKYCPPGLADELGLHLGADAPRSLYFRNGRPGVEVHSVRVARRCRPDGEQITDLVVEVMQRRRGYLDSKKQLQVDQKKRPLPADEDGDFTVRGGCTVLIDPATSMVRYAITKHILSNGRLNGQRSFLSGDDQSLRAIYFGDRVGRKDEPFAVLHRSIES